MAAMRVWISALRDFVTVPASEIRARPRESIQDIVVLFAVIFPMALLIALLIQRVW